MKPDRVARKVEQHQWLGARGFVIHSSKAIALLRSEQRRTVRIIMKQNQFEWAWSDSKAPAIGGYFINRDDLLRALKEK